MSSFYKHSVILLLTIFLASPLYVKPQHTGFISAPLTIKSSYESRKEKIVQDLERLKDDEWAGIYFAQTSLLDGALLHWSAAKGFTVRSGNDFHRGIELVNYGSVNFNGKLLTLSPDNLGNDKHTYTISTSFVPVKWDKQHWLIPSNELMLFSYAVNSGDYDEIYSYFVKDEDKNESNSGLPNVPGEYRKYLNLRPIKAKVSNVKINNRDYTDYTLTLNAGKAQGVIEGMKFYLIEVKDVLVWIRITDIHQNTSIASIITFGSSAGYDKEIKPEIGWEFTSQKPEDY